MRFVKRMSPAAVPAWALAVLNAFALTAQAGAPLEIPAWVYPSNSPVPAQAAGDPRSIVRLPGSSAGYTEAQLVDLFSAPDWGLHPHGPMPAIVAHGRKPDVRACGFCHTPTGQGRPENASLAGLPRVYLAAQLRDFREGRRHAAWPGSYPPADLMIDAATHLTDEELDASADYFSSQQPVPRTEVRESRLVPRARVVGLVYAPATQGGTEPLGQRLLEFAPDATRHERRDDAMRYLTYVPPGSLARGRILAMTGRAGDLAQPCSACHGTDLRGTALIPGIGGRSPTYLLRSLLAFRAGARTAPSATPMRELSAGLSLRDMIDAAAYAASLPP